MSCLQSVQILQAADDVALQKQDNQVPAGMAQELYLLNTLLVQV